MRLLAGGYHASAYAVGDEWVVKFHDEAPALELVAYAGAAGIPVAASAALSR